MNNSKVISVYAWLAFVIFLICGEMLSAQEVGFKPRTSQKAPAPYKGVTNYNLQGDFVMLGNGNLTFASSSSRNDNTSNNQGSRMVYIDIDGDNSTINSSSAELKLGDFDPTCSEIIYAGLYWTGKGDNSNSKTVRIGGKDYYKSQVKLKKEGQPYFEVNAGSEIYYPGSNQSAIYVGYADVTDYVKKNGVGNYFVADLALVEGTNSSPGYFGGWGMVVVYKNSAMKWRDITVFDGYAYISSGSKEFDISGFRATQKGDVNIKMGIMAGEGDRGTSGDYIEIRNRVSNSYTKLAHGGNSTNNFFNASIYTGNNNRNPYYANNAGVDIAMFDLPNSRNSIIDNNQSDTKFRYGTNGDFYSIYSVVFAVDAYVPEVVGENNPTNFNGVKPNNNGTITPGQEFEFQLDVYNKGEEAVESTKIEIPVPSNLHYVGYEIKRGDDVSIRIPANTTLTWVAPAGAPIGATFTNTAGGKLVWDIGTLPKDNSKSILQGFLKYRFRVSDNCVLLSTSACGLEVKINGKISGKGVTSGTNVSSPLVRDYGNGACAGPVYDDFMSTITLSEGFLQGCNPPVENGVMQFRTFCSVPAGGFPRAEITGEYPFGAKFFNTVPTSYLSTAGVIIGDFPVNSDGSKKMYYVMVPGMEDGCYAKLEISVEKVVTEPTAKNVAFCFGDSIVLENALSPTGITNQYSLAYFDDNNNQLQSVPNPTAVGVYNYFVAEGKSGCIGPKKPFTITINALPVIVGEFNNIEVCTNFDGSTTVSTTGTGLSYAWEYSTTGGTTWQTLSNTTFSGKIILTNSTLEVKHAEVGLNGTKVRLKVGNGTPCSATSNVFEIKVKDCPAVTNPMLLNRGIQ